MTCRATRWARCRRTCCAIVMVRHRRVPARGRADGVALMASSTRTDEHAPHTMRYVAARTFGPPEVLTLAETDTPRPGPDEVLIAVHYAGVNRPDCSQRAGTYP